MVSEDTALDAFSFAHFSDDPNAHKGINEDLVSIAKLSLRKRIMDLGCGVGGSTKAIIGSLNSLKDTVLYAVDLSSESLKTAAKKLADTGANVKYIEADASNIEKYVGKGEVDGILYCNSIHYVPDKKSLFLKLKDILAPKGVLAFNSSFVEDGHSGITRKFYNMWALKAVKLLKKEYGLKISNEVVESRKRLSSKEYFDLLEDAGFTVTEKVFRDVPFDASSYAKLSEFRDWIQGFLPGVPLNIGRKVLQSSVYSTFEAMQLDTVPRLWLQVVATKP